MAVLGLSLRSRSLWYNGALRKIGLMNEEEAIKDFLGDRPDSQQLNDWRVTLEQRLAALQEEQQRAGGANPALRSKIEQLKKQVAALREEEAVTQFVEDSVRVTLAMGQVADPIDEES